MANGAPERYPAVRVQPPPAFLQARYGDTAGLIAAALQRVIGPDARPDVGEFARAFPTFQAIFDADEPTLAEAAGRLLQAGRDRNVAQAIARSVQRLLVFENLDDVLDVIRTRLVEVVEAFPRTLQQLEEGGGGRDVIDPFIVAIGIQLLRRGALDGFVRDLLVHKCFMKLEDLIGHLHEEVLGRAAGKQRVAEPAGVVDGQGRRNKENWHAVHNPYPGADARLDESEFYQIKNKTGSAKGSDGEKLGRQFHQLGQHYPGSRRYYVSMIGRTLAGHRSMGAFLRTDPQAEVLVGLAAFQQLGGHRDTPAIVLELVLEVFDRVQTDLHYDLDEITASVLREWRAKHGNADPAKTLLKDMITGYPDLQQSSTYGTRVAERRARYRPAPPIDPEVEED